MKVTIAKESNTDFKPIEVNIKIESAVEYNAIIEMTNRDVSIPEQFDIRFQQAILDLLIGIRQSIYSRNL